MAISDFTVNQTINYYFDATGQASVQHLYKITNNFSQIFPKEYTLEFPDIPIKQIVAHDATGQIDTQTTTQSGRLQLLLKLNHPKIGQGQATEFTLSYNYPHLAQLKGNTWEIELPQFVQANPNDTTNISLNIPASFGRLSFSSTQLPHINPNNNRQLINLSNSQLQNQKTLLIFGDYQLFDFSLTHSINNPTSQTVSSQISLPPDTASQQVIIDSISLPPNNVEVDSDGNWLAKYTLAPNQSQEITVTGQVKIFSPRTESTPLDPKPYLESQPYWPVSSPVITTIANSLKTPQDIYHYVINHLEYNYNLIGQAQRRGALQALESPQNSLCTEFTDLFVTLARAKAIPAREIEGYALTNNPKIKPVNTNTDILHAWPQYYHSQKKTWVDIDPTWEKTTHGIDYFRELDLNHFTFVIHGLNSQDPSPPNRSAHVNYASQTIPQTNNPLEIRFIANRLFTSPVVTITNTNNYAINHLALSLPPSFSANIKVLPPYGQQTLTLPMVFFPQKLSFSLSADNYSSKTILLTNNFHYLHLGLLIAVLIILLSISGIILTISRNKK